MSLSHDCPQCGQTASANCWNTHLGWCPTHKAVFESQHDQSGPGPCPTCFNVEYAATEAYSRAQGDSMAAAQAVETAKSNQAWSLKHPGSPLAVDYLIAVETTASTLRESEAKVHVAYQILTQAIQARRASQDKVTMK
ncbi:hypothetical protein BDZ97DRAFT_684931 [Flammula alnicola]|nr:hypothetical protein BDZ97DRAFT_684931 [Flammula alnicola]